MTHNLRVFLATFILSLPFWWGINLLEGNLNDFFFWHKMSQNPEIFTAQINLENKLRSLKPIEDRSAENLEIGAEAAISYLFDNQGKERILFEKNKKERLPIASLTKLMTAHVVLKNYDLSKEIKVSKEAIEQEENLGKLMMGKVFPVKYLLYPLLMESSNDAAFCLANDYDGMNEKKFVDLMNMEAERLELYDTFFINPTGLDPEDPEKRINYSTAENLAKFVREISDEYLIWEILSTPKYNVYGPELVNINRLLEDSIDWKNRIIGGKTGYTEKAGGCFILALKAPKNNGILVNVILGTDNRFSEMKSLVNWLYTAYKW